MHIRISSGDDYAVLGLEGAQLNSLVHGGREYLWQGNPKYWAGQAPVCFPIVGVLPFDTAYAFGKECRMRRHGIARNNPFETAEQSEDSVTFVQRSSAATKKQFPFDYELKIRYTIKDSTVTNEYIITNTGAGNLPFVIGGHPAFRCPVDSDERFEDYKIIFDKPIDRPCLRPNHATGIVDVSEVFDVMHGGDTLEMRHDLFEEKDALIFENCPSKSVTLIGKNGRGVKVDFDGMNNLLLWSAVGEAPFVAIEPWTGLSSCTDESDVFEEKRGMTVLAPGETVSFRYNITMF
jgi:galactose mutarotase-like enzyme